ncbi:MAG: glycosyltransferase, partial [Shimia sp.]
MIAAAETLLLVSSVLFFFDIWNERDTPRSRAPSTREGLHLVGTGAIDVDVFITTYDEDLSCVEASVHDALALTPPPNVQVCVWVLDDGDRVEMKRLSERLGVGYLARRSNEGFKAGNLKEALLHTRGDFVVICDADTRLLPTFLVNTLGYFLDAQVAWVQTPHWFYDIPQGTPWRDALPRGLRWLDRPMGWITGVRRCGADPFMVGSSVFFDVIQRRRNRHGASFCCGAGSIHRREPLFAEALRRYRQAGSRSPSRIEPFRFHVSEDMLTSLCLHGTGRWKSIFHPDVEARMLSPWSVDAWAAQKLKYAGGTFDVFLRTRAGRLSGIGWPVFLHYAATFASYVAGLVQVLLLFAPMVALATGLAPVSGYSSEFFLHLVPMLLMNELALVVTAKGADLHQGRLQQAINFPFAFQAFIQVLLGRRIGFRPTPKVPGRRRSFRYVRYHIAVLGLMLASILWGVIALLFTDLPHT